MDLPLNVAVYCLDGLCGRSQAVILDSKTEEVTHLVVKRNHSPHAELLVPVDLVQEATTQMIRLNCTKDRLVDLRPFQELEIIKEEIPRYLPDPYLMRLEFPETRWVPVRRESVPPGHVAVHEGARVEATDGRVGRLDEFLVDPATEQVTHLVMREGHLWGQRDVTIPVSEIDHLQENAVYLRLNKKQLEALPSTLAGLRQGSSVHK